MENAAIVTGQVIIMGITALVGYLLGRGGKLHPDITVSFSNVLLYAVTPCVIIHSMQRDFLITEAKGFLLALLLSAVSFALCIALAHWFIRRRPDRDTAGVERFALVMPNTGYIGIPLVQAVLGEGGVFYLTAYIVLFNLLMFSYGRYQLSCDGQQRGLVYALPPFSRESLKKALVNPATISVAIGGALYLLRIRLPELLLSAMRGFTGLNSVLSMMLIGIFLSQTGFRGLVTKRVLGISALRLILLPLPMIAVTALLPAAWLTGEAGLVKTAMIIASCTPVAVACSFMGELCGADNFYAVRLIVVSTLMSILTMPVMLLLWEMLPVVA